VTGRPISLSQARKSRRRAQKKAVADANAAKHGRSKAERLLQAARDDKARRMLDGHKAQDE